jgi:cell fate (sporulation/competence/biofilm development) regulator YlbF (YheA/YmcA/DUF963 family)
MVPVIPMERTEIALEAWRTVDDIRNGEEYRTFALARDALLGPSGPADAIARFTAAKERFAEASARGRHHPDFSAAATDLAAAKDNLYSTPEYGRYIAALAALNAVLEGIAGRIRDFLDSCLVGPKTHCGTR